MTILLELGHPEQFHILWCQTCRSKLAVHRTNPPQTQVMLPTGEWVIVVTCPACGAKSELRL